MANSYRSILVPDAIEFALEQVAKSPCSVTLRVKRDDELLVIELQRQGDESLNAIFPNDVVISARIDEIEASVVQHKKHHMSMWLVLCVQRFIRGQPYGLEIAISSKDRPSARK